MTARAGLQGADRSSIAAPVGQSNAAMLNSPNPFKLAIFGLNVSNGLSPTTAEGTLRVEWQETLRLVQAADALGFDGLVPISRWRGFGGTTNFNDRCFETFTWAAAVAAVTKQIQVFATTHVATVHPVRAAKESATVDHIANGRFGLNVVAGYFPPEVEMFGELHLPHDERYAVADEWMRLVHRLWSEDTFDFAGKYYTAPGAHGEPKPIQTPGPVIMNAGNSGAGAAFAAEHAHLQFINLHTLEGTREQVEKTRKYAKERFDREVRVMAPTMIISRATEQETRDYFDYISYEKVDHEAVRNIAAALLPNAESLKPGDEALMRIAAGFGGFLLVGTPEQVVHKMAALADAGLDGATVSWPDFDDGIRQYEQALLPLMRDAGLRI